MIDVNELKSRFSTTVRQPISKNQILYSPIIHNYRKSYLLPEAFILWGSKFPVVRSEQVECMGTNVSEDVSSTRMSMKLSPDVSLNPLINRKVSSR